MIKYFAYGSNMLTQRLEARCPSARVRLVASADDWTVTFFKKSLDGSGKATLAKSNGKQAYGIVFDLEETELQELDGFEGVGQGYDRTNDFPVYIADSQKPIHVVTYIANPSYIDTKLEPYDWYLKLVLAGARQHNLPFEYVSTLEATSSNTDPKLDRKARCEALKLLASE